MRQVPTSTPDARHKNSKVWALVYLPNKPTSLFICTYMIHMCVQIYNASRG
ncbi:MAG: hypothetical protein ACK55Z_37755 [bacterium]